MRQRRDNPLTVPSAIRSPVILLLAAGEGSRFGGAKQLATIAGEPMVRRVARMLTRIGVPVVVVIGAYADEIEPVLADLPLHRVRCEQWRRGMGDSLAYGASAARRLFPDASAMLVCLADQPLLDGTLIQDMLRLHASAPDRLLATDQGPPALFPRRCFDKLEALSGPYGARALLKQEAAQVDVFSSTMLFDVDTKEDLQHAQAVLARLDHRQD